MNSVIPVRITFRTTFFDSLRSRQIVLIPLPSVKCSRLIFAIVSTISILRSASDNHRRHIGPNPRSVGSLLDADHPRSGVLIPRRSTSTDRRGGCRENHHRRHHAGRANKYPSVGLFAQVSEVGHRDAQVHPCENETAGTENHLVLKYPSESQREKIWAMLSPHSRSNLKIRPSK